MPIAYHKQASGAQSPRAQSLPFDCRGAYIRAYSRCESFVLLAFTGVFDIPNVDPVSDFIRSFVGTGRPLVLDLYDAAFVGNSAVRALPVIAEDCLRTDTDWALIVNAESGALRNEQSLPLVDSLGEALGRVAIAAKKVRRRSPRLCAGRQRNPNPWTAAATGSIATPR